jgi:hypothetical protein
MPPTPALKLCDLQGKSRQSLQEQKERKNNTRAEMLKEKNLFICLK